MAPAGALVMNQLLESLPLFSATFFTVATLAAGVFTLYFYAPSWRVRKVPGPLVLPLIGHLPLLTRHGLGVFDALAKRYGPIYRFHMGRQPLVIVADAELCREVGIKKFKSIPNRSMPPPIRSSPVSKGLFMMRDSRWQSTRNVVTSVYQPTHLASLIPSIQPYVERAGRLLRAGEEIDFSDFSLKLFSDTIGQVAFGVDFGLTKDTASSPPLHPGDGPETVDAATSFIRKHYYATTALKMDLSSSLSTVVGMLVPLLQEPVRQLLRHLPCSADRRMEQTNIAISGLLDKIVAERAAQPDRGQKDFLSAVLNASESSDATRKLFTQDYVSALTYEHLLGGSVSSAFALSSLAYLVAMHPEVEEKLLREIDAFGPKDVVPSAEELRSKFPYLEQVLKETMRFFDASPVIAREASEEVQIGGYVLPKGTWVWMAPGVLAKDPKHFPEPGVFRPERFDPENEECKQRHPYAFFPFGIGPRACLGKGLAIQELKLIVIHFYRHYVFRHSPRMEFPLEFEYSIVVHFKHGVKLQVIERKT